MRIGQTSFIVFLSKLLSSVLGFIATLYFARTLGAEVLGYYALVLVVANWLKLGGELGVISTVTKRVSEGEDASAYFTAGLVSVSLLAGLAAVSVLLFRGEVNAFVGTDSALFVVSIVVIGLLTSIVLGALNGQRLVHITGILSPVQVGVRSFLQIALVVAGYELFGMLVGYVAASAVVAVIGLVYLSIELERPTRKHFGRLFDFAKFSWLGSLRGRAFNDIDIIVLGVFVSPALVGVYSIAWNLTSFIGVFGSSIRQTTFPELSNASAHERDRMLEHVLSDSLAYSGLIAIPGLFGGIVLADRLLRIYGKEFSQGATVLGLLILAMLVYDYQNQLLNVLNAIDRPDLSFRVNGVFVGTNFVLNVVLVSTIGFEGAAIATVCSAIVGVVHSYWYLSRLVTVEIPFREITRQVLAAISMTIVVGVGRIAIESIAPSLGNWVIVLVLVAGGAGTYFLVLLGISRRFRSTIADNSPIRIPFVS